MKAGQDLSDKEGELMDVFSIILLGFLLFVFQDWYFEKNWAKNLEVTLDFQPKQLFVGDKGKLVETIINRKLLPLPWIWVKFQIDKGIFFKDSENDRLSDDYYSNDIYSVLGFQKIERSLEFECRKRGYYNIKTLDVVAPNVLFTRKMNGGFKSSTSVLVYPRFIKLDEVVSQNVHQLGDTAVRRFINPDPFEFASIRDYQPHDTFKSINFAQSAKLNKLMVNACLPTAEKELIIVLNFKRHNIWDDDALFEGSISIAATIADTFIPQGFSTGLISNGCDFKSGDSLYLPCGVGEGRLYLMLEALARIDLKKDGDSIIPMLENLTGQKDNAVVVLISSHHDKELIECYEGLKNKGISTSWIMPRMYYDMNKEVPEISNLVLQGVEGYDKV